MPIGCEPFFYGAGQFLIGIFDVLTNGVVARCFDEIMVVPTLDELIYDICYLC